MAITDASRLANFASNVGMGVTFNGNDILVAGVVTATTFTGNVTGNVTGNADTATYTTTAGLSTYSTTAGVSTNSQGLTGTPNIIVGIVTATSFVGPSEVGIQSGGVQIGAGITQLNFIGTGNTFAVSGTTVDVSIAGGGGGGGDIDITSCLFI